ncbi:hypothetical protein [Actinoplanes sp. NPDC051494]|uniref:hypothetical protein n=1 Tax=Actinoplanes sp. NPDC051494 TaxID=3363907 RepID=UPI003792A96F
MIAEVGARLDPAACPPEGAHLTMVAGLPVELTIVLSRPHELEVQAVAAEPTQFAWVDCDHAGVLVYRFGPVMPWSQAAYNPHLTPVDDGQPGVDRGQNVQITLIDHETKIVRARHRVHWPDAFAAKVRASVARMRTLPYDKLMYDHALAALHRRYPTPEDLVLDRADAQCTAK